MWILVIYELCNNIITQIMESMQVPHMKKTRTFIMHIFKRVPHGRVTMMMCSLVVTLVSRSAWLFVHWDLHVLPLLWLAGIRVCPPSMPSFLLSSLHQSWECGNIVMMITNSYFSHGSSTTELNWSASACDLPGLPPSPCPTIASSS